MKYSRDINNNNNNNDDNNMVDVYAAVFNAHWPCVISEIQWALENAFVPVTSSWNTQFMLWPQDKRHTLVPPGDVAVART